MSTLPGSHGPNPPTYSDYASDLEHGVPQPEEVPEMVFRALEKLFGRKDVRYLTPMTMKECEQLANKLAAASNFPHNVYKVLQEELKDPDIISSLHQTYICSHNHLELCNVTTPDEKEKLERLTLMFAYCVAAEAYKDTQGYAQTSTVRQEINEACQSLGITPDNIVPCVHNGGKF
ncbi:hypothetical protein FA15DRAFT_657183 [Coprinopsis marcescibilis]|uniref:Uncharacterized protein n=1 Tax=Coprinopsis marcescibilis TaxID=230819 RepID=A0A5C3L3Y9_COPMA|nr:hypothetical protein FA15DRAFT_657183 [Coprinopsis marcescibilis]